ncbi:MAG: AraC family transcriptional regulator [Alphaproteobacteria bacterium]
MDALSTVLGLLRLKGCVYFVHDFCTPWGMQMDDGPFAPFHAVVRGQCRMSVDGQDYRLSAGDVVMFPKGCGHALDDGEGRATVPGMNVVTAHADGRPLFQTGEDGVRLLCGHFELDRDIRHPVLDEIPAVIHAKGLAAHEPGWLDTVMGVLVRETDSARPGATVIVERLAEILFVQTLRAWLDDQQPPVGFLAAARDPRLARALQVIHQQIDQDLSLQDVARAAGMSRSTLAHRFHATVGTTPMRYQTMWRMLKAREHLRHAGATAAEAAARVGYASEAAFSRAFKKHFQESPGAFRRSQATDRA